MILKIRFIGVIFVLINTVLFGSCSWVDDWIEPLPTDQYLVENFNKNGEALQEVKDYFDANPAINYVFSSNCEKDIGALNQNVSEKICQSLKRIGSSWAEKQIAGGNEAIFIRIGGRYLGRNEDYEGVSEKTGYAYSTTSLSPVYESLNLRNRSDEKAYVPLKANWYLFYGKSYSKPE
jgi:hypothetical protein